MTALRCRILPEGTTLEPSVRHMRLHLFAVVVLGSVLLRLAPMYPAFGMSVYCDDMHLYRLIDDRCFIYKAGESLFQQSLGFLCPRKMMSTRSNGGWVVMTHKYRESIVALFDK